MVRVSHGSPRGAPRRMRVNAPSVSGLLDARTLMTSRAQPTRGDKLATPQPRRFQRRMRGPVRRPEAEARGPRLPSTALASAPCRPRGAAQAQLSRAGRAWARRLPHSAPPSAPAPAPRAGAPRPSPPPCPSAAAPWHRTALAPWWGQARSTALSPLSGI